MLSSTKIGRTLSIILMFLAFCQPIDCHKFEENGKQAESGKKSKLIKNIKNFLKNNKTELISGSASAISTTIFCTGLYFYLTNWTIDRENGLIFLKWTPILSIGMGVSTGLLTKLMLKFDNLKNFCPNPLQSFSQIR